MTAAACSRAAGSLPTLQPARWILRTSARMSSGVLGAADDGVADDGAAAFEGVVRGGARGAAPGINSAGISSASARRERSGLHGAFRSADALQASKIWLMRSLFLSDLIESGSRETLRLPRPMEPYSLTPNSSSGERSGE